MSEFLLAPVVAGCAFAVTMMLAALLWPINRPWDIVYRIFFAFFSIFVFVGTMGAANSLLAEAPLNLGSSPSISVVGNDVSVAFFNSTGDLMYANSTLTNSSFWSVKVAASLDGVPAPAASNTLSTLTNMVWFLWIFTGVWFTLFIVEIGLWYRDFLAGKKAKRNGSAMMGRQKEI